MTITYTDNHHYNNAWLRKQFANRNRSGLPMSLSCLPAWGQSLLNMPRSILR